MTTTTQLPPFLIRFQERPEAKVRLVCFAHAGGSASTFAAWHRLLPPSIEVLAVQLPGRENFRDKPFICDMARLPDLISPALMRLRDRPLVLLGYSLGAIIAFDCARMMRRLGGESPSCLLVAAAAPPDRQGRIKISHLPRSEFLDEMGRRYGGIPKPILDNEEMLEYFLPILRADLRLLESHRYLPEPPLDCPIHAFGGTDDSMVPERQLERWSQQTESGFGKFMFEGGHFFLTSHRDEFVLAIREVLTSQLSG